MKSIIVEKTGGIEVLQLKDIPIPKPGQNQVLIKLKFAGVNPLDTLHRSGAFPHDLPFTPGSDASGIVEAVGPGVSKFKKGDKVFSYFNITGSYAEYVVVDEKFTFPLGKLSFEEGAATSMAYFSAYMALFQRGSTLQKGNTVLVHGASGGVGIAAVQLAKARGVTVIGTAGTAAGITLVKDNGADHAFNHKDANYKDQILKATNGVGVDYIVEMAAHVNLDSDLDLIAPNGRIMIVGCTAEIKISPMKLMMKHSSITGMVIMMHTDAELAEISKAITDAAAKGTIKPVFDDTSYPLSETGKAMVDSVTRTAGAKGRILIKL